MIFFDSLHVLNVKKCNKPNLFAKSLCRIKYLTFLQYCKPTLLVTAGFLDKSIVSYVNERKKTEAFTGMDENNLSSTA